ncbi:MAG: helix-turn-helix domain-containing protein [Spirochaetaceae bacterium]|nr:helix-turn-helix domain-containing protein [Spirochaetaceae bacterium]
MKLNNTLTDAAVLEELGKRLARARITSSLTQADLANRAAVGKRTVERIEAGESVQLVSLIRVLRVLDLLGVFDTIAPDEGPGPMELLERGGETRRRVSSSRKTGVPGPTATPWVWGDER